jgi:hypothetical protein
MRRLALIAAAGIVLAGCGGSHKSSSTSPSSYPVVVRFPLVVTAHGLKPVGLRNSAQFISRTRLGIVTLGSSSCPSVPDELVVQSRHRLRIHLTVGSWMDGKIVAHPPPGGACTADYGTTPMAVAIDPKLIDVHSPLTVRFFYNSSKEPVVLTVAPLQD